MKNDAFITMNLPCRVSLWQWSMINFFLLAVLFVSLPQALISKPLERDEPRIIAGATIDRIWEEHNVLISNQKGVLIHVKFNVSGAKGKQCSIVAYFHDENGRALRDLNGEYRSSVGTVSCLENFTPSYDNSSYADFRLFMPYSELHLSGEHKVGYYVMIRTYGGEPVRSAYYSFSLNWGNDRSNDSGMGSLVCNVNCPKNGQPCKAFTVSIARGDYFEESTLTGSGTATFEDLPAGNYKVSIRFVGNGGKQGDGTGSEPSFSPSTKIITIRSGQRSSLQFD